MFTNEANYPVGLLPAERVQGVTDSSNPGSSCAGFRKVVYTLSAHLGRSAHDRPAGGSK